ncbi:hypothetical protein ACIA5A_30610 [Micromonospora sp. NPDC051300]|uniref:hypothetical protein n=1 Tax=Micromonospora sp. NPDC051300 TaxID=3364286 RepID=UPI0037AB2BF3
MSTAAHRPTNRNARPYEVDSATIRRRVKNPDAAEYTLYVRSLISDYVDGGQAQILRTAHTRRLTFPGLNRQKLSENLNGRYRLGPSWDITELIIGCLPDSCDTASIRAHAAGWYQCARNQLPDRYNGPVSRPPGKPGLRNVPESEPAVPVLQRKLARLQERLRDETSRHVENLRASENGRNYEIQRANEIEARFHETREELLRVKTIAADVATIREEYARQCVALELIAAPLLRDTPIVDFPELPTTRRRIRFGHLVATIDAQAPPARRALARYLCAYAEFAGTSITELASRTDLAAIAVTDILAGRLVPSAADATRLAVALHCVPDTLQFLRASANQGAALDECFWRIADAILDQEDGLHVPEPIPPSATGEAVGSDSDNRVTRPDTSPTTPTSATLVDRLRQLNTAHREGLISDGEYDRQRTRILDDL